MIIFYQLVDRFKLHRKKDKSKNVWNYFVVSLWLYTIKRVNFNLYLKKTAAKMLIYHTKKNTYTQHRLFFLMNLFSLFLNLGLHKFFYTILRTFLFQLHLHLFCISVVTSTLQAVTSHFPKVQFSITGLSETGCLKWKFMF